MSTEWSSIRVSGDVKRRAAKIRDMILRHGEGVIPQRLRGQVDVPPRDTPKEIATRKFGVGQVVDLALSLLEAEVRLRP